MADPTRRGFLGFLACAPAIIRTPGLLMPVRALAPPPLWNEWYAREVRKALLNANNRNRLLHALPYSQTSVLPIRLPHDFLPHT